MLNECACLVVGIRSWEVYWRLGNTPLGNSGQQSFFDFEINPLRHLSMTAINMMIVLIFISKLRLLHHFPLSRQH